MNDVNTRFDRPLLWMLASLCLSSALLTTPASAEIYKWTDENGLVHFGDRPPQGQQAQSISTPEAAWPDNGEIESAPETPQAAPADASNDTATDEQEPVPLTAAQARREKMANERKERSEAQGEMERMCQKHRKRLTQMEPARRVFYTNEQGESVRMDDDMRMKLIEEDRSYINENCD